MSQLYFVRLWQAIDDTSPLVQERVASSSEGQAVIKAMKAHRLHAVARAYVSHTVSTEPTVRLIEVFVRGGVRRWRQEPDFLTRRAPL